LKGDFSLSKHAYSKELKLDILRACETTGARRVAAAYNVSLTSIKRWKRLRLLYGEKGLEESSGPRSYTKELKMAAVSDYLSGGYSKNELLLKHGISNQAVLNKWLKLYTGHKELRDSGKGSTISMTKRTTTFEERVAIAKECIETGKDYLKTAEEHNLSYQQVYSWVTKYLTKGANSLHDKRGKRKAEELLSPEEKKAIALEQENERLRAELAFLKKLKEYEGRDS
jgi:transposase